MHPRVCGDSSEKMCLIRKICHPRATELRNQAIRYGRDNEPKAKQALKLLLAEHINVKFEECGLYIYESKPFIAASPDLMMQCDCCEKASVEIKCPFRLSRESLFNQQLQFDDLEYLERTDGDFNLRIDHNYYAQVQTQIFVTDVDFGIFFVWAKESGHVCIKIKRNERFWNELHERAELYFSKIILPELLANRFMKPTWWT